MNMKYQVVAIFAMLCFATGAVNANDAGDAIIGQLKKVVRLLVKNQDKAKQYMSKIDSASECLSTVDGINPVIMDQIKDCLKEKNNFNTSILLTPAEIKYSRMLAAVQYHPMGPSMDPWNGGPPLLKRSLKSPAPRR
ncbi:uncharacterized protein LOC142558125 [Dermacentor variabilis]|uniref:uncharacterized protein LOC142558125 n=1 Tax=Dermacentor variabilis TaxID=34621 RepID=UPI003F5BA343